MQNKVTEKNTIKTILKIVLFIVIAHLIIALMAGVVIAYQVITSPDEGFEPSVEYNDMASQNDPSTPEAQ